jgi:4,5-DOPA dioxygenase extradiol
MNDARTPALFVGHGSPMNAISTNGYTKSLGEYSAGIKAPAAIVVISAHWQTDGSFITGSAKPEQIYDFYGFPQELYDVEYSPRGLPEIAEKINSKINDIMVDNHRGIDHAGWAVLKHLYPEANIPLLELSLDVNKSFEEHYELGKRLSVFRNNNVMFIGSGNIVHNLRRIEFDVNSAPYGWAVKMDEFFRKAIKDDDIKTLIEMKNRLPDYATGIPTDEHYIPLLYIAGMKNDDDKLNFIHESILNGSISMRSFEYAY